MGKRKQDAGQEEEPRKRVTRQEKGKDKIGGTPSKKDKETEARPHSPKPTKEAPARGILFKSVGKKKSIPKEVTFIGNPSLQFRNREHKERFKGLKSKTISCGRELDWKSFESSDIYAALKIIMDKMKWERIATFDDFEYSEVLVKEFYASIPTVSDKSKRNQDESLECFVNGMEVTITGKDLGMFLETEHVFGMAKRPTDFDVDEIWKEFTDSSQTMAQNSASSLFKLAVLKILHAFINGTLLGRQGSHSSVTREEVWIMHQAMKQSKINTAQIILDNIKNVGSNVKFVLPYGHIITGYFRSKRLWNSRYETSLKESSRKPISASSLLDKLFTLKGRQWVKKDQSEGTKSSVPTGEEDETETDVPATEPTPATPNLNELFSRIEVSLQNLRIEITERFDLQEAKLDALTASIQKLEQQNEMHAYGHTAERNNEKGSAETSSSSKGPNSDNQKAETSRRQPAKQTLEHLSEAASTFETQINPTPKPPAYDMLFMFPSK